ncbi:hypothetical protein OTU49_009690 [Cherax quadricarinatus]|uniref:VWFA domain-containing protein n=3 Tax=Cherax quadricarinatus TaxID=27406 RepID=A0AAW0Y491_CHEQU
MQMLKQMQQVPLHNARNFLQTSSKPTCQSTPLGLPSFFERMRSQGASSPKIMKTSTVDRGVLGDVYGGWQTPKMVWPDPVVEEEESSQLTKVDLGEVHTDATLYALPEMVGTRERLHTVLHMPTDLPVPDVGRPPPSASLNILMVDVSASMKAYWKDVVHSWNSLVAPTLYGRTILYAFGTRVLFLRSGTQLEQKDFISGGTDLVGALRTIVSEVYQCREKYIKVFLITDGEHTVSKVKPESVIEKMEYACGKICDVFVLGVGDKFPVQHSIDIRSRLHNGNSNLPYLFTAKTSVGMREEMAVIGRISYSSNSSRIKLSLSGSVLPGGDVTDVFHLGEWVYFACEPQEIQNLTLSSGRHSFSISLKPKPMNLSNLSELFRQWNSLIIQLHRSKKTIPSDIMAFKDRLFSSWSKKLKEGSRAQTINDRLTLKEIKTHEASFRAHKNYMETILMTETFQDEQELADKILFTTVGGSKYETKVLRMKGHTDQDFSKDQKEFMEVYEAHKANIKKVETTPEDCCRITLTSTITDLQDTDFSELFQLGKYEFLKQFTMTGIPVFAPIRDSMIINPWSYSVRGILSSPYTILSQVALESFAETTSAGAQHKDVRAKWDEANTRFNAIVPVFPPGVAKIMEPFVHTRIYAMCVTFAILKNPHIIDFNVHIAALAITWMRILYEYPTRPRPEFVRLRIESIKSTAALYLNQPSYLTYWKVLRENTAQALMTESTIKVDKKTLKCESLIKPMFILHMNQHNECELSLSVVARVMRLILVEFIGRCLANYNTKNNKAMPFTDFFVETHYSQNVKKDWVDDYVINVKANLTASSSALLEKFYTLEEVKKAAKQIAPEKLQDMKKMFMPDLPIKVNMEKVVSLRNVSGAGDVSWHTLRTFAKEADLSEEVVNDLFSERSVFIYVAHALRYKTSRSRLSASLADYNASLELVTKHVQDEILGFITRNLNVEFEQHVVNVWLEAYLAAHREVVQPLKPQEIVVQARQRGIDVSDATFDRVYKRYRSDVRLLGNACQSQSCPFYLVPNKRYNQHTFVERQGQRDFPHTLHRVAYLNKDKDLTMAVEHLELGAFTKNHRPLPLDIIAHFTDDIQSLQESYKNLPGT